MTSFIEIASSNHQEIHGMAGNLLSFAITIRFYCIDNNACNFLSVLLAAVSTRIPLQHHNHQHFRSLHSLYQLGRAEDILFFVVFREISCNVIILVLVLPLVMLNEHGAKLMLSIFSVA
jgi:hypothetical protein